MNLDTTMKQFVPLIEAELQRVTTSPTEVMDGFYGMMHYHLGWVDEALAPANLTRGKRLRPAFTLICCQAAGGDPQQALPAAAAVELVHNFSLIHDDIEDRSHFRHARPTLWAIWGEAQAINAGDTMFTLARNTLLHLTQQGLSLETTFNAIDRLDRACLALVRGQYLDMDFEQTLAVTLEAYLEMIEGKTAQLLACSGYLGGLIATESTASAKNFWDLGLAMGLSFQIQDDILGIWGDEEITGKPAGDDLRRRKKSMPVVYALNHKSDAAARFREIYTVPEITEDHVAEAMQILEEIGARSFTMDQAKNYVDKAEAALLAVEASASNKAVLQELAHYLIQRVH